MQGFADRPLFEPGSFARPIADNSQSGGNADPGPQLPPAREGNFAHRFDYFERGAHRLFRAALGSLGVAEITEYPVALVLRNEPVRGLYPIGATPKIRPQNLPDILGVELGEKTGRPH